MSPYPCSPSFTDVLGLQAERLEEFKAGKVGFPSVRINGDTIIDLFPTRGVENADNPAEKRQGNLNHFCMVVERQDFSGIVDYLARHGISVREGPVSRWGRVAERPVYFLDLDGNEVEIRATRLGVC
jgi:extradiol dioxygenase family protein